MAVAPPLLTVLVVEDEFLLRADIGDELREAGYTVIEASNGIAALEILTSATSIGLVCTDIRMPGAFDGIDLARWIKRNRVGIPVVIVSGEASVVDHRKFADAAFPKPVNRVRLIRCIFELLSRKGGQQVSTA